MTISHLYQKEDGTWVLQSNEEHQKGVAKRAQHFGESFDCGELCATMGLLHDLGKEQSAFQQYIKKSSGFAPDIHTVEHPNHAYVGALAANALFKQIAPLFLSPQIASHHSGLKDELYYEEMATMKLPSDVQLPKWLSTPMLPSYLKDLNLEKDLHHLERMLFSCLVDADYLDTEQFMNGKDRREIFGKQATLKELLQTLETRLSAISSGAKKTAVNEIRSRVQEECRKKSEGEKGFYSLTVPTGGGKTLSGILWALRHAVKNNMNRVIIAIPYTSIIVQTAQVLRDIFGADNVLEHHSAFDSDNIRLKGEDVDKTTFAGRQRLASENWDYPIIVTTNVQLFQSMMAAKPSRCRKLHNIVNSVIILDEAQMLPTEFLQPIVDSLDTYKRIFGCSVLFTTASQPVLDAESLKLRDCKLKGLEHVTEIIPRSMNLHDKLRRVELHFEEDVKSYDEVAASMSEYKRVLCIVNKRRDALEIFSRLPEEEGNYHLSRMMCSAHIADTLKRIREDLSDPDKTVRVVATQLIEAGVDVDFPVVMRQEAGLDSILQAAGRCNREGKQKISTTFVFKMEGTLPSGFLSNANNARLNMLGISENWDWFSTEAMNEYFHQLYSRTDSFDKADVRGLCKPSELKLETLSQEFRLIEDNGISVYVNYGDCATYIEELKTNPHTYSVKKRLSKYAVDLYDRDFKTLWKAGIIEEVLENVYYIPNPAQYNKHTGLSTENQLIEEILLI